MKKFLILLAACYLIFLITDSKGQVATPGTIDSVYIIFTDSASVHDQNERTNSWLTPQDTFYIDTTGGASTTNADSIQQLKIQAKAGNLQDNYILKVNIDGSDTTWDYEADASGGTTAYDDIADPDGNGEIAFSTYTGLYSSTSDTWAGLSIHNTNADVAAGATLLNLLYTDDNDADGTYLLCTDNAKADTSFRIYVSGMTYIGAGGYLVFEGNTNDDYEAVFTTVDPTADRIIYIPNSDQTIGTATSITNGLVNEPDLDETGGAPSDNDVLTYNLAGTNYTWVTELPDANVADDITIDFSDSTGKITDGGVSLADLAAGAYAKDIVTTSPITGGTDNVLVGAEGDVTIAINDADDDGSTKGAASFDDTDFDAVSGNVTINDDGHAHTTTSLSEFGTMTATDDNILVADGGDFESVAMSGDATIDNGAVAVSDLTISSEAQGDILYRNASNWVRLAKGTAGQVLEMNEAENAPEWDTDDTGAGEGTEDTVWIHNSADDDSISSRDNEIHLKFGNGISNIIVGDTGTVSLDTAAVADAEGKPASGNQIYDWAVGLFATLTDFGKVTDDTVKFHKGYDTLQLVTDDTTNFKTAYDSTSTWDNLGYPKATVTTLGIASFADADFTVPGTGEVTIDDNYLKNSANDATSYAITMDSLDTQHAVIDATLTIDNAGSIKLPAAANPTTDAEGEIAWDADDDAIEVYSGDESESGLIPFYRHLIIPIVLPDSVQAYVPDIHVFTVNTLMYPHGIEIDLVSIQLEADAAYSMVLEEWSGADPPVYQNAISTVTTGASDTYAEEAPDTDGNLDAGDKIYLDLPTTDVDVVTVEIFFHVTEGD